MRPSRAPVVVAAVLVASCAFVGPGCQHTPPSAAASPSSALSPGAAAPAGLTLAWDKNLLHIHGPDIPGGRIEVWYLEAFCRSGSTRREWGKTVIPHHTEKLDASADGKRLRLRSSVGPAGEVEVLHEIVAGTDEVDFRLTATNNGAEPMDIAWAQPCVRVGEVTGRDQSSYLERSFIFVEGVLTTLDKTERTEDALYRGGQVYVPSGISHEDVNPRPISLDEPSNGLIGCFSEDGRRLLALAWEPCQELFQGVIVCLHADFRIGGLEPGETRRVHGKLYWMESDVDRLLERYRRDFPE